MTGRWSRRAFIGVATGAVAVAAGASVVGGRACRSPARRAAASDVVSQSDYVDRDGWMLTAADDRSLGQSEAPARP